MFLEALITKSFSAEFTSNRDTLLFGREGPSQLPSELACLPPGRFDSYGITGVDKHFTLERVAVLLSSLRMR